MNKLDAFNASDITSPPGNFEKICFQQLHGTLNKFFNEVSLWLFDVFEIKLFTSRLVQICYMLYVEEYYMWIGFEC